MCTFAQRHIWDRQKGQAGIIPAGTGIQCTVAQLLCAFAGGLRIAVLLTQATACAMLVAEKIVVEQRMVENEIQVKLTDLTVKVTGEKLLLSTYVSGEIVITGEIENISYTEK